MPRQGAMKTKVTLYADESMTIEAEALEQIRDAASIDEQGMVIATPDIHTGYGVPIGSIFASREFVSPAAVGYDINCGMRLLKTPFHLGELSAAELGREIRSELPLGEGKKNPNLALKPAELNRILERGVPGLRDVVLANRHLSAIIDPDDISADLARIEDEGGLDSELAGVSSRAKERGSAQLGTLGGGNHFVEIQCVDEIEDERVGKGFGLSRGQIVIMIHSGSRGLGHEVASDYMRSASSRARELNLTLPNKQLAYLPATSEEGQLFLGAMAAAANFAFANRQAIAAIARRALDRVAGRPAPLSLLYDVSHNIAKREHHGKTLYFVHRKGATRAFPAELMRGTEFSHFGQPVLIPGSMGTASYVLVGLASAAESLYSVNHGAGRLMSRSAAAGKVRRRDGKIIKAGRISDQRFRESMAGVTLFCEDPKTIKEEAPDAYKNIDLIVDTVARAGLAKVVARLRPLAVLKG